MPVPPPPPDAVARVRRFNRAITRAVGALNTSFLDRGRPLGAARVLNAIGQGRSDLGEIRAYLGLDSGLMSRLLRGLEAEGLVATAADAQDSRRRVVHLTPAGAAEFAEYERLSDAQAAGILATHPDPGALLAAMDLIGSALGRDRTTLEVCDPRSPEALRCLQAYYAELAARLPHSFDVSLSCDPQAEAMMAPHGAFIVAMSDGLALGCVGLKGTDAGYAEIKRLWVAPAARGLGLARRLMDGAEAAAQGLGIALLRLDTNSALPEAIALYRATGWTEIARFNDDPYPDVFFEKRLAQA
ncbi:GNAT family N-acetyltransferase [Sinirhodobacter ferrireducens]|uniref:GNAT family N-acetyltransferase n=1 Tax=Paenirhodobacter ferrireducens TaxID=1215032 RepID=A0A443LFC6_9RHOB|nr:bifunctional helix-turn-helix transcriptional regulator/GNAT family N-acetyltransferase [Sinirhodobacter ferrireducens]RWR47910.1 GNAT family N-acetyltransferase [Sinirhodobacter ferrireducens]